MLTCQTFDIKFNAITNSRWRLEAITFHCSINIQNLARADIQANAGAGTVGLEDAAVEAAKKPAAKKATGDKKPATKKATTKK